jgi:hypothetical protein
MLSMMNAHPQAFAAENGTRDIKPVPLCHGTKRRHKGFEMDSRLLPLAAFPEKESLRQLS